MFKRRMYFFMFVYNISLWNILKRILCLDLVVLMQWLTSQWNKHAILTYMYVLSQWNMHKPSGNKFGQSYGMSSNDLFRGTLFLSTRKFCFCILNSNQSLKWLVLYQAVLIFVIKLLNWFKLVSTVLINFSSLIVYTN